MREGGREGESTPHPLQSRPPRIGRAVPFGTNRVFVNKSYFMRQCGGAGLSSVSKYDKIRAC